MPSLLSPIGGEYGILSPAPWCGIAILSGGVPVGSGFGISYFPIILEKSSNLLIIDVYTVKNVKKSKKCFLSYDLPDSADRSVSRRRYY